MQIVEANADGLKRTLKVVVGAGELGERFETRLDSVKGNVQLKGFRKGKVPLAHIKKVYGRSLMTEVLQDAIRETSQAAIKELKERPAQMPDIALTEDQDEINRIIEGKSDLAYSMTFEVLPEIKITDLGKLKVERLVAKVDDETIENSMKDLLARAGSFAPEEGRKAEMGDRVSISYVGRINGEEFEGGKGDGLSLTLGSANFIPGFEEGIVGAVKGERRDVACTFPEAYPVAELTGKSAVFDVTVNEVEKPVEAVLDDEFAKSLGADNVDNLKKLVSEQIEREFQAAARVKLKRELLDELEKAHPFELPPSLVQREFDAIWMQLQRSLQQQNKSIADEGKSEEELRAEYQCIAERRVRLGLVVGQLGDENRIEVTQDELRRALMEHARRYPGQEKFVYEYFEKTPGAIQELRAPIFEDKVVDFVLEKVKPAEKVVTRAELFEQVKQVTEA